MVCDDGRSRGMALRNQLPLERIRVFGLAASSLLAHIKFPVIAPTNRQPRATNDRSNQPKTEGVPLVLTANAVSREDELSNFKVTHYRFFGAIDLP